MESSNESSSLEARRKPQNSAGCRHVGPGPIGGAETHVGQGAETRVGSVVRHAGTEQQSRQSGIATFLAHPGTDAGWSISADSQEAESAGRRDRRQVR